MNRLFNVQATQIINGPGWVTALTVDTEFNVYFQTDPSKLYITSPTGITKSLSLFNGSNPFTLASSLGLSCGGPGCPGVCLDYLKNFYTTDGDKIYKYNTTSGNVNRIAEHYVFHFLSGIAADVIGNLYVTDSVAKQVYKINSNTNNVSKIDILLSYTPNAIAVDVSGIVYVSDSGIINIIHRILLDGTVSTISPRFYNSFHFTTIGVDTFGNVFAADSGGALYKFDLSGDIVNTIYSTTTGNFGGNLYGIAVDIAGNIYASASSAVYKINLAVTNPFTWANPNGNFYLS